MIMLLTKRAKESSRSGVVGRMVQAKVCVSGEVDWNVEKRGRAREGVPCLPWF